MDIQEGGKGEEGENEGVRRQKRLLEWERQRVCLLPTYCLYLMTFDEGT